VSLSTQLHVGRRGDDQYDLTAKLFKPIRVESPIPRPKPRGGLWTSTWHEEYGGGWVQWCLSEEFECDRSDPTWPKCWLLDPAPDARVYTIDSYADLQALVDRFPHRYDYEDRGFGAHVDLQPRWLSVAEHYDGVHLTDAGQWATRLSHPLNLYGWDCESTLWFRWSFERVEYLGPRTFKAADPWWEESLA
jgi:hypothetical protein